MTCEKCELYKKARIVCMPLDGDYNSQILLIGEGPGAEEDNSGRPFMGKSGKLLKEALRASNIIDIALTNTVRCRPPNNRPPDQKEIDACLPHLWEDINKMPNLKLVVPVGNIALRAITGKQGILKVSGEEQSIELLDRQFKMMPLMHPSYVLQNQVELDKFFDHVSRIPMILKGDLLSEKDFGEYIFMTDFPKWQEFFLKLKKCRYFSYDVETNGLNPFVEGSRIKCIQFSIDMRMAYVLPLVGWTYEGWDEIHSNLKDIFENKRIGKIGQNIKFDNLWMRTCLEIDVKGTIWDTKIAEYLLIGKGSTGLKEMAWRYSKMGSYEKQLTDSTEKMENSELLWRYGAIDADLTYRIFKAQLSRLTKEKGLYHLNKTLLVPVSDVLRNMEYRGILVDKERVQIADIECNKRIEELKDEMRKQDSVQEFERSEETEFNPNSSKQLQYILYKIEGLPVIKKTDKAKAPSVDKEVLEYFKDQNKLCHILHTYSAYNQMKKTFIKELTDLVTPDNRIHCQLWLTESHSRTSSKHPNMQNMPKGKNDFLNLRKCFIADPGYVLAEFDMNQHELRVMAEIAQDKEMMEDLKGDVHRATTADVLGIPIEQVTEDQRREIGKTINFGIIYELSSYGLANRLKITEKEADLILYRFFNKHYKIKEYQERTQDFVKRYGYVEALSGRRRYFPYWEEFDDKKLKEADNFNIQATASDILLYGAISVERLLRNYKSFLVLEVHDSLLINLHKSEFSLIDPIKEIMCNYFREFMPFESELKVDLKIGNNWKDMEDVK